MKKRKLLPKSKVRSPKNVPAKRDLGFSVLLVASGTRSSGTIKKSLLNIHQANIQVDHEYTLTQALERLGQTDVDVILLDLFLPDSGGIDSFTKLAVRAGKAPIIILVDKEHQDVALEAVRRGAQDYVIKGSTGGEILFRVLHNAIERRQAEERLLQTTLELNALFQAFPDLSLKLTAEGVIIDYNAGPSADLFALPLDFLGKSVRDVFPPTVAQVVEKAIAEVKRKKAVLSVEYSLKKRGVTKWFEARLLPFMDTQVMMVIRDITERMRLEFLRDEFVSAVSHELRTPMTIMKEAVMQVTEGMLGNLTEEQRDTLKTALEGIDRLKRLIDDLLDLSKLEAGRMTMNREKVDIGKLVRETVNGFKIQAKSKGLELKLAMPQSSTFIYADRDKIIQVLVNLIGNALKFTEQGFVRSGINILAGGGVECFVEDSGVGIAKENLSHVFDKFQQFTRSGETGQKGTGLGLSLCKALVEMHDGRISVESEFEKGCRFIFTLPGYSSLEIFKQHLLDRMREAAHDESTMVVARVWIKNFAQVKSMVALDELIEFGTRLEKSAKECLRRRGDFAVGIRPEDSTFDREALNVRFIFPQAQKSDGSSIIGRLLGHLIQAIEKERFGSKIELAHAVAAYPDDGHSVDELLKRLYNTRT